MKKVLVVDDDPALLEMMKEVLLYDGYEVKCLSGTSEIFHEIQTAVPDW